MAYGIKSKLKKKYPQVKSYSRNRKYHEEIDKTRKAKPVGWRKSSTTKRWYFEARENRSDKNQKRKPFL